MAIAKRITVEKCATNHIYPTFVATLGNEKKIYGMVSPSVDIRTGMVSVEFSEAIENEKSGDYGRGCDDIHVNVPLPSGGLSTHEKTVKLLKSALAKANFKWIKCSVPGCGKIRLDTGKKGTFHSDDYTVEHPVPDYKRPLCATCWGKEFAASYAVEEEKEKKEIAAQDKKMKAKGFTHKAAAWIHAGGDDVQMDFYFKGHPAKSQVEGAIKKQGSRVLTDYAIVTL